MYTVLANLRSWWDKQKRWIHTLELVYSSNRDDYSSNGISCDITLWLSRNKYDILAFCNTLPTKKKKKSKYFYATNKKSRFSPLIEILLYPNSSAETQRRPIQRAPSRLYKVDADVKGPNKQRPVSPIQKCVGPEFVIRATRQPSMIHIGDIKVCTMGTYLTTDFGTYLDLKITVYLCLREAKLYYFQIHTRQGIQ